MGKWHELTERVWVGMASKEGLDSFIKSWLESRANALGRLGWEKNGVRVQLGLTEPKEPVVEKKEWCEHIKVSDFGRDMTIDGVLMPASRVVSEFRFCPICGTPKPKTLTLEEKFKNDFAKSAIYCSDSILKDLVITATIHFNNQKKD